MPLLAILLDRIRREGPLSFAAFMEAALYHPEHGYYLQPESPLGPRGDFVTAPDHHPAFGRLVGRRVRQIGESLAWPAGFTVVEMGAGSGALAEGILEELRASRSPAVRYRIVEPFAVSRTRQEARVARFAPAVEWIRDLKACAAFTGVFLSNELPDAFPVHRVRMREGRLREFWVTAGRDDSLFEIEDDLSTPDLQEYFNALGALPPDGKLFEVSLGLAPWVRAVAQRLERGSFLTIDYGATAEELFAAARPHGTLRCCRGQRSGLDPLTETGRRDLSAAVDFTTFIRTAEAAGLRLHAFTTQRQFLRAMGWEEWLRDEALGRRRALSDLIDPVEMGGTRVLEMFRA